MGSLVTALGVCASGCTKVHPSERQAPGQVDESVPPALLSAASSGGDADRAVASAPASGPGKEDAAHEAMPASTTFSPAVTCAQAVQLQDWADASALLAGLDLRGQLQPIMRYVRGRVALATEHWSDSIAELADLETLLPDLADDIAWHRAIAQIHGDAATAIDGARYLDTQSSAASLVDAATGWIKAQQWDKARASIDRAIVAAGKRKDTLTVNARLTRSTVAAATKDMSTAVDDLHFVLQYTRDVSIAQQAVRTLRSFGTAAIRSSGQHLDMARLCAATGTVDATNYHLERHNESAPTKPDRGIRDTIRATALFHSRANYEEAANLFSAAMQVPGAHQQEATYLAARAWSRAGDNARAIKLYQQVVKRFPRTASAERALYHTARLQRLEGHWKEAIDGFSHYLQQYPRGLLAHQSREELALCLLLHQQPARARKAFDELATTAKDSQRAAHFQYMSSIATYQMGRQHDAILAWRRIMQAYPLSYFALAAASRLVSVGETPPAWLTKPVVSSDGPSSLAELPSIVELLHQVGLSDDAQQHLFREQPRIARDLGQHKARGLCDLYGRIDAGDRSYQVAGAWRVIPTSDLYSAHTSRWAWHCAYPRPFQSLVARQETQLAIPSGLTYAIMRQESGFRTRATSEVGARGLLQLMPNTARRTAQAAGQDALSVADATGDALSRPGINIRVGTKYLSMLLKQMNNNAVLAVSAYNAGPQAVGRWVQRYSSTPIDIWIALIPYDQTRTYVWRVLENWARYRFAYDGPAHVAALELTLPQRIHVGPDAY